MAVYLIAVNLGAVLICMMDKKRAIRHKRRISERTLFIVAAMGSALSMLITMIFIRHKTKHKRFMLGLPVIFSIHLIILYKIQLF